MTALRFLWVRSAVLAIAGAAAVFGCSSDEYHFVPDQKDVVVPPDGNMMGDDDDGGPVEPPPPPPPSTPTACTSDDDCTSKTTTTLCDTTAGYCVECDPSREADLKRCGEGTFCAADGHCQIGCESDANCRGVTCDTDRGLCINCNLDSDCAPGTTCADGVCTPGCSGNDSCPYGWLCCDGLCQNTQTDATACGACGTLCDPGGACWNGICGEGPCAPGTAECDGDASNGCETGVTDDPANCGKCKLACASNFCAGGECTTMECAPGTADCNGNESDHCETDLTDVDNCLMCRTKCSDNHGTPSCGKKGCEIACADGFDDCDADVGNGCEINLDTDADHCGDCDTQCTNDNGSTECKRGECVPRCAQGFADCDGNPSNGCETNTDTSLTNCGACGKRCNPANAKGTCADGVCTAGCKTGFEDCDGNVANGCEADLTSPETCGSCEKSCSSTGGKATCSDPATGTCTIVCDEGKADCVNGIADGCETDTTVSTGNCGACGNVCTSTVGIPACQASTCGLSSCTDPNRECVPDDGKKCETNVLADPNNCGDCGIVCAYKNGKGACSNKTCSLESCDTGYADCNSVPTDGCEVTLNTTSNCRRCGESCTNYHGTNDCTANGCQPACSTGWGDCDGNKNNGCETQLNTLTDCGACGVSCTKAHGTPTCASGSCQIASCNSGWDDCSSNENTAKDGCETQLNTLTNCNGCGVACSLAHGTASCGTGQCVLTGCNTGYSDCNSQAGCETALGTTSNCAACGDTCSSLHASAVACTGSAPNFVCSPTCSSGYKSCDGNPGNGCEADLHTLTNCGDCGVSCNLANAVSSCSSGTCVVSACNSGYLDCTSAAGCETQKGTLSNCRTCNEACTNAHGTTACDTTNGCTFSCSSADWGNCDSNANNGCETSLTSLTNCGTCGTPCDVPNSSESCATRTCVATSCAAGFDNCETSNPDCEQNLKDVNNCNGCGHVCSAQNGTTACTGSAGSYVCTPTCNSGFKSCDGNPDNGCERSITTLTDCGNCNVACAFTNASASCTTGTCTFGSCNAGYASCDGTTTNGCEVQLGTVSNCAACGNACTNGHGGNACTGSPGAYDCAPTCDAGYKSCDSNPDNGCETPTNTATDCGNCGVACSLPHGTSSCTTGSCVLTGCSSAYADCNSGAGCETPTNTVTDCGGCGIACTNANGTTACTGSACSPTCSTGFKSCDADPNNGCERNIRTVTDCGDCNSPCSFANSSASCSTGTCTFGSCNSGYASCDGTTANGCETQLGTASNCSTCGDVCSNSHGTTSCDSTNKVCAPVCSTGFGDCNGNKSDGCEADLTTAAACGACGNVCSGATPDCVNSGGVYKCQGRVKYENDVESTAVTGGNPAPTLNITHNLTLTSAANRLVLAAIISQCTQTAGIGGARPTAVTYGGVTMTHSTALEQANDAANTYDTPYIYYYYLTDAGTTKLPASGNQTLAVTATNNKVIMLGANVIEFSSVDQTAPLIIGTGKSISNSGGQCVTTNPVTTTLGGAGLYALTAAHYYGTPITAQGGLTQSWVADAVSNSVSIHGGYRDSVTTPLAATTAYTIGFTYQWCSPAAVLPLAIVPYRQP